MSKDVKMFCACNHYVNSVKYEGSACPRCYGKGFYFDIFFDDSGYPVLSEGGAKLQQEVLKIMLEEKGQNIFHPNWGNDLTERMIGTKNLFLLDTKIELIIRQTLSYLQTVQTNENDVWDNMSSEEMLAGIKSIEIFNLGKTGYQVKIKIENSLGQVTSQSLIF